MHRLCILCIHTSMCVPTKVGVVRVRLLEGLGVVRGGFNYAKKEVKLRGRNTKGRAGAQEKNTWVSTLCRILMTCDSSNTLLQRFCVVPAVNPNPANSETH